MGSKTQSNQNPSATDYRNSEAPSGTDNLTEDPIFDHIMGELDMLEKDIIKDRLAKMKIFKQPLRSVTKEENMRFYEGIYEAVGRANLQDIQFPKKEVRLPNGQRINTKEHQFEAF